VSLVGSLRYNRLHEILVQEIEHAANPFAGRSFEATRLLSGLVCVGGRQDGARRACGGLNLRGTARDRPAASFNLRLSEALPGLGGLRAFGVRKTLDTRLMVG